MGSITSSLFISLDGVTEAPDTWHFPYFNDEMGAVVGKVMAQANATLLGRRTYDEFAGYWPTADPTDPMTDAMNSSRKFVVSTTMDTADWQNSTVVPAPADDALLESLTALKAEHDLGTTGSSMLVRWMLERGLVDELHLLVHPIVVGHGGTLFTDGTTVPLTLAESTTFSTGVLHLVYTPAQS